MRNRLHDLGPSDSTVSLELTPRGDAGGDHMPVQDGLEFSQREAEDFDDLVHRSLVSLRESVLTDEDRTKGGVDVTFNWIPRPHQDGIVISADELALLVARRATVRIDIYFD
jgi:hypothetical protein